MTQEINPQLALICGVSASGKSASLRNLTEQDKWIYAITEAGKRCPFKNTFKNNGGYRITDPHQVIEAMDFALSSAEIKGIIVDSITYLMGMYESQYVLTAPNTMSAWSGYQQFFKRMMQEKVAALPKPVLMTAHLADTLDERAMEMKTAVPIKGALAKEGLEAYFSTVVYCERKSLIDLEPYLHDNPLLTVTEDEELDGFKYVYQTRLTTKSLGTRIRSPIGMFSRQETYMDNDAQLLLNRLTEFYG